MNQKQVNFASVGAVAFLVIVSFMMLQKCGSKFFGRSFENGPKPSIDEPIKTKVSDHPR